MSRPRSWANVGGSMPLFKWSAWRAGKEGQRHDSRLLDVQMPPNHANHANSPATCGSQLTERTLSECLELAGTSNAIVDFEVSLMAEYWVCRLGETTTSRVDRLSATYHVRRRHDSPSAKSQ
eukprot:scpid65071/ scgid24358/ 